MAWLTNLSLAIVHGIFEEVSKFKRINSRLISNLLTDVPYCKGKGNSALYPNIAKEAFDNLIIGDETFIYQNESDLTEFWPPNKRHTQLLPKEVLYVIFFDNKSPVILISVSKDKTVKKISIETCSQKIYEQLQKSPPKTGLKYFRLYNAPNQKARIVPSLWSQRKLPSSYILRFHQTWHPMTISCLQNSNIIYLENDTTRQIPLDFEVISI